MNTFSIGEIFKTAWARTKAHMSFLVVSTLIFLVVTIVLQVVEKAHTFWSLLLVLVGIVISIMFNIGIIRVAIALEQNSTPTAHHFTTDMSTFWNFIWGSVITAFFVIIGFILLIIPGIIVAIRLSLVKYLIVDKKMSGWTAVKESWNMTKGHSWKLFWFIILVVIVALISVIPFGLGLLISIPFISIAFLGVYRKLSASAPLSAPVAPTPVV